MKLLLIEDSEQLQESLNVGLHKRLHALDSATDGETGLRYARHNPYDVIILDLMLPKMDGLTLLKTLRAEGNDAGVLVLSAKDTIEDRVIGLKAGADDYLVKPFAFEELLARLNSILRRRVHRTSPTISVGNIKIDLQSRTVTKNEETLDLTRREYMLIEYLARRPDSVVTRKEIEDNIYNEFDLPTSNAVDRIVCTLRSKLGGENESSVIKTHRGRGYRLVIDGDA